ncbi:hypothetical protein DFP93_101287 [Aneurinibacillus soli]|uniref:Uncharacterized protein n=1 Tax=Aneurinibacillus soli TaxID=1500254 RepID=A0A0U5B0V9_9BACL|nr:hypothetical protein [Aneurinibacillus soli]PYE64261.1 hypothetical protein DFP93_101287 [Aneurinibacillus soli]BAU28210.1 hypothetical protein CB4_02384 [Aneurinibacillus soli]
MPMPNTSGQLRSKIQDMQIGDYIKTYWTVGSWDVEYLKTTGIYTEYPVTGVPWASNGFFYFIKADKGLLISDRVIFHTKSWDFLNGEKVVQGRHLVKSFDGIQGIIRSLGGGNAYTDANGNMSLTDKGLGAWPTNNEWDEYIVRKDYGTGAGRDDVWHWNNVATWCQETPVNGFVPYNGSSAQNPANNVRVGRGQGGLKHVLTRLSGDSLNLYGFRPVFEYKEV